MNDLKKCEFTILDVETTGLSSLNGDRVIEIAALKIRDNKVSGKFETFVDPQRELSYEAFLVNGITDEMLKGAPKAREILPELMAFIGDSVIVGHNVKFDLNFINNELDLVGHTKWDSHPAMDTIKMARGLIPGLPSYSLTSVARHLGIVNPQQHRAMSDVVMTHQVFDQLLHIAGEKNFSQLEELLLLFGLKHTDKQTKSMKLKAINDAIDSDGQLTVLYAGRASGATSRH